MSVGAVRAVETGVAGCRTAEDKNIVKPSRMQARVIVDVGVLDFLAPLKSETTELETGVEGAPLKLVETEWFTLEVEKGAG